MKNLVLWSIVLVVYFISKALECSENTAARSARIIVSAVLGGTIGFGFGQALAAIL